MKTRTFDLIGTFRTFVANRVGPSATRSKLPRHVAEERRIARGEPVNRNATTLLRTTPRQ